ncbi:MAG: hypothetical protein ACFCUJ_06105 [Thiotrichales bacterium]
MKTTCKKILTIAACVLSALPLYAQAGGSQVNERTHMPASSSNQVMHLRIQAMTVEHELKDKLSGDGFVNIGKKSEGCKLSIGNRVGGNLSTQSQDIYIDGPIINYCR